MSSDETRSDDIAAISDIALSRSVHTYLRLRSVILTVMACIGLCSFILFIGAAAFGLRPMIVISGSMEPTLKVGSMIFSVETAARSLHEQDVVTVRSGETQRLVTHRIVESKGCEGQQCSFILKGDANIAKDPHQVTVGSAPRLWLAIPHAGWVILWMRTPTGLAVLLGCVVLLALMTCIVPKTLHH